MDAFLAAHPDLLAAGPLGSFFAGSSDGNVYRIGAGGEKRGGLLTQGAILTVSSYPTRTSPPVRGKWVLENLLGAPPPLAPAPTRPQAAIRAQI